MILYQPQLVLLINDGGDYVLHSTTNFPQINIQAHGYSVSSNLTSDMVLEVELHVVEDSSLPDDVGVINSVVHVVNLGQPFGDQGIEAQDGTIEATIYIVDPNNPGLKRKGGSGTVKNPSTSIDTKPAV